MAKATFKHKLGPGGFELGYFLGDLEKGEEVNMMDDILDATRRMETATKSWSYTRLESVRTTMDASSIMHAPLFDTQQWEAYVETQESQSAILLEFAKDVLLVDRPNRPATEKIGNSVLDVRRGFFAHVWKTAVGAVNFRQSWERMWKVVRDHRIIGLVPLCCATFSIQGEFVSVVPIPAVYTKDVQPVRLPANPKETGNSSADIDMASQLARTVLCALGLKQGTQLEFWKGLDGRYYALNLGKDAAIFEKSQRLDNGYNIPRQELLVSRQLSCGGKEEAALPVGVFIYKTAIPATITSLLRQMADDLAPAGVATGAELVKESYLRSAMKKHGVNMCFLYELRAQAETRARRSDGDSAKNENEKTFLGEIIIACHTEMLGRVLKHLVRTDIKLFKAQGKHSEEQKLDVANRIARFTLMKDDDFWTNHVNPCLRRKYRCPEEYVLTAKDCHLPSVVRLMSNMIGCSFTDTGRFSDFVDVTSATMSWHEVPELLQDVVSSRERQEGLARAWENVAAFPPCSALHQAYLIKAINTSILSQDDQIDARTNAVIQQRESLKSAAARVALMSVAVELNPPKRSAQLYSNMANDLMELGKQSPSETQRDLTSPLCGYYYLYLAKLKAEDRVPPVLQFAAAVTNTTRCRWVHLAYHPLLKPSLAAVVEERLDTINTDDTMGHYCDTIRGITSHYIAQDAPKVACAEYIRVSQLISSIIVPHEGNRLNLNGLVERRALCADGATLLQKEKGDGSHEHFLMVSCIASLAAQGNADNTSLQTVCRELVEKASYTPTTSVERTKHRIELGTLGTKAATIEALRVCIRYSEDKAKKILEDYVKRVDDGGGLVDNGSAPSSRSPSLQASPIQHELLEKSPKNGHSRNQSPSTNSLIGANSSLSASAALKETDHSAAGGEGYNREDPNHRAMVEMCMEIDGIKTSVGHHSPEYYVCIYGLALEANKATLKMAKIEGATSVLANRAIAVTTDASDTPLAELEEYSKMLTDSRAKAPGQIVGKLATLQSLPQRVRDTFAAHMAHVQSVSVDEEIEAARTSALKELQQQKEEQLRVVREAQETAAARQEEEDHAREEEETRKDEAKRKQQHRSKASPKASPLNKSLTPTTKREDRSPPPERPRKKDSPPPAAITTMTPGVPSIRTSNVFGEEVLPTQYSRTVLDAKRKKEEAAAQAKIDRLYASVARPKLPVKPVIYCPVAIRPLDKTPEVAPPEETTPCFEIKFTSKIPPHPCEAQMRKKDATRRAQAAMEMAQRGKGRNGMLDRLEKIPTLRSDLTAMASPARKGSGGDEHEGREDGDGPDQSEDSPSRGRAHTHTMLVGPVKPELHKHVHLSQDRRRPHSVHPISSAMLLSSELRGGGSPSPSQELAASAVIAVTQRKHSTPQPRSGSPVGAGGKGSTKKKLSASHFYERFKK